jgi:hypothetical protein
MRREDNYAGISCFLKNLIEDLNITVPMYDWKRFSTKWHCPEQFAIFETNKSDKEILT